MRTNKKVMIGALLLFMMMAANFQNALNDYGIRSNAFMNGVIASGSEGSGTDYSFDNWNAWYPDCGNITKPVCVSLDGALNCVWELQNGLANTRECLDGAGLCCWNDDECCIHRLLGMCTDSVPIN